MVLGIAARLVVVHRRRRAHRDRQKSGDGPRFFDLLKRGVDVAELGETLIFGRARTEASSSCRSCTGLVEQLSTLTLGERYAPAGADRLRVAREPSRSAS